MIVIISHYKTQTMYHNNWYDYVKYKPHKDWSYAALSKNPNITWEIVQDNPHRRLDYSYLSINPNITWDIVEANPNFNWDYAYLSANKMLKHPFFANQLSYVLK